MYTTALTRKLGGTDDILDFLLDNDIFSLRSWSYQVGKLALKLLWLYVHFIISVFFFVLRVIDGIESRLISIGLLKQYKVVDAEKLRYLGIVVDSEEARQISKVIRLLKWLHHIGVKRVCLYDTEGVLKMSKDAILRKLSYVKQFEDPSDFAENKMIVEFLSQSDGKEAVARAANLLLMQQLKLRNSGEDKENKLFTESQLTEALKAVGCKGPDPDLLLVYGSARCHLGFPAWRLRYTEIVYMGSLLFMRYGALRKAIYKFTLVRQNYGK